MSNFLEESDARLNFKVKANFLEESDARLNFEVRKSNSFILHYDPMKRKRVTFASHLPGRVPPWMPRLSDHTTWSVLDKDTLLVVIGYCDMRDVVTLSQTCRGAYHICQSSLDPVRTRAR